MAYIVPATVVVGEMLEADGDSGYWSRFIKANADFFATHTHDGTSGGGSQALEPATILLTDQADPSAPASGKAILWTNTGTLHQRTFGGSAEEISVVGHAPHFT